ncbi:unnamed protein product [Cyprideis torosa]|uniref:Uncharacterized protein n=1 Tax=Cyprideis torosa TaxID=163714 RepID=A0A7R8WFN2_9CRUS|nr:unnamed protein product [Cyprideis torosa]CAG0895602.1 unnamed protein product [Cyprideis torosa]
MTQPDTTVDGFETLTGEDLIEDPDSKELGKQSEGAPRKQIPQHEECEPFWTWCATLPVEGGALGRSVSVDEQKPAIDASTAVPGFQDSWSGKSHLG